MTSSTPAHVLVPPQSGRAVPVERGSLIRITDPQGQQVADTWALTQTDGLEWLSTGQTRTYTGRLFPMGVTGPRAGDARRERRPRLGEDLEALLVRLVRETVQGEGKRLAVVGPRTSGRDGCGTDHDEVPP